MRPFFSIGVTTYDRIELLKECLSSILQQTFSDFEVIIGNDYTQETLSAEVLGIEDPRIRFVNYAQNLGELGNMNSLLRMGRGRYFTWLADDDMYVPAFLESVQASLVKFDFPPCVFTSYSGGTTFHDKVEGSLRQEQLFTGPRFVQLYLARKLKAVGCYGVFDREYIRQIGGIEQLGNGFSPYSDNLLVIRSGLLEKIVYIDAPLVFYRTHEGSISHTSTDLAAFRSAQEDLCRKSIMVFRSEALCEDFHSNLYLLLKWCIRDFTAVVRRSGLIDRRQVIAYLVFVKRYISLLKGSAFYWRAIGLVIRTSFRQVWHIGKQALLRTLPAWAKRPAKRVRELWRSAARGTSRSGSPPRG